MTSRTVRIALSPSQLPEITPDPQRELHIYSIEDAVGIVKLAAHQWTPAGPAMTFAWWLYCTRKGANPWSLQEELSAFYEDQESSKDSGEDPDRAAAKGIEHIRTLEARESEIRLQMADQIQLTRRSKDGKLAMHALAGPAQG